MALLPPSHPESDFALLADEHDLLVPYRFHPIAVTNRIADLHEIPPVILS
jgi:hypothetical protein